MHPAVHGTELIILLCAEAIVAPATAWGVVLYIRESLKGGREVN